MWLWRRLNYYVIKSTYIENWIKSKIVDMIVARNISCN
jgi:hypothetical protein